MRKHNNAGFTLLEMIAVLFCVSMMYGMTYVNFPSFRHYQKPMLEQVQQDIIITQLKAMATLTKQSISINEQHVTFNHFGNVNKAQTIEVDNHQIVMELGAGRFEVR